MSLKSRLLARRGLTLLELVVVIAILAALAGMVVPRLDFLKSQADAVADANTSADLVTMIETYKTSTGAYPALDTLTNGSNLINLWSDGGQLSAPITPATLTATFANDGTEYSQSLIEGGLTTAMTNTGTGNVSNSGSTAASLFGASVARIAPPTGSQNPYAADIFPSLFPLATAVAASSSTTGGVTTNTPAVAGTPGYDSSGNILDANGNVRGMLIALGVGQNNGMVGNVMASSPLDTQGDDPSSVYCRYIALFAVYTDGTPAQLKMVIDHRLKSINTRLQQYQNQNPTKG